ncbi:helix-turn-helix domain-containing protein [Intestinimonas massiliensis (ex Afouda et al. 2020)]|uniref:helix-turn-helix domain-containing protein n=1 Tax=Intestinimonas massiliensis (ex Afouda et al. 2020) TaxID=1673721 RepID=UPI001031562B|nr:helix-turn-helix transcriptional regulator [Intestinimonas massiliensis (ex Afouda et al. 2020)]
MTLGQRIQTHRTRLGLSQEGLGVKLGVSRQAVSKWEADGAVPDTDKLIALSKLFGITLNELLQVEGPVQPEAPVPARRSRRRVILPAALAAALVLLAGLNLWLTFRVGALEEQVAALQSQAQELDPAELVADWGAEVLSFSSAGRTVEFQVTTARYDPAEEMEVFFLIVNERQESRRAEAVMVPEAPGVYTARVEDADLTLLSQFTLSAGFVRDGVEYVCPLAEFSKLTDRYSSYTSLWP